MAAPDPTTDQVRQVDDILRDLQDEWRRREQLYDRLSDYTDPGRPKEMEELLDALKSLTDHVGARKELLGEEPTSERTDLLSDNAKAISRSRHFLLEAEQEVAEAYIFSDKPVLEPNERHELDALTADGLPGPEPGPERDPEPGLERGPEPEPADGRPILAPLDSAPEPPRRGDDRSPSQSLGL